MQDPIAALFAEKLSQYKSLAAQEGDMVGISENQVFTEPLGPLTLFLALSLFLALFLLLALSLYIIHTVLKPRD